MVGYFELRALIPLAAYAVYLILGDRFPRCSVKCAIAGYALVVVALVVGMFTGVRLSDYVGSSLSYESAIEGAIFGTVVVYLLFRASGDAALSIVSSILVVNSVGWLYEVSFWHPVTMFVNPVRLSSPMILHPQIVCLILFAATLWIRGWRPGRLFLISLFVYLVFSVYLFTVYPDYLLFIRYYRRWLIRLPSYTLVLSVVWEASRCLAGNRSPLCDEA